jgi:hypothetical protein
MKIVRFLISLALVFCFCISFISYTTESAPPPSEYTTYIYSDSSVFVSEFYSSTNFNSGSNRFYLDVGEDEFTYSYVSFVRFDLNDLPEDADIISAEIGLYLADDPQNIPVKMYKVRQTWSEDLVTWNTKPSYKDFTKTQGLIDSITISSIGRSYWNATNTVKGWFDGSITNYGVAFESTGEYFHRFSSDESTHRPVLSVIYMSSSGDSGDPPEEPPEDSEPCEISYTISPQSPVSGDTVTITATATDNLGLEYLIIKEGIIELCSEYATDNETTIMTCSHTETMFAPGKTFIIEANDKGGSPPQSLTLPITVIGSGGGPAIDLDIEFSEQNTIPAFYRLLPSDNQTVNITATATDPDGINFMTISVNGALYDFSIVPEQTSVTRTVSVINSDSSIDTFRYYASATDMEGYYTSESGEDIEIRTPFQWYWGLNFSNWGCDKNHTWSWDMMEIIFGDSDIYLNKELGWKKDWAWRLYDTKVRRGGRNGHCWGMCTLALELAHSPARITAHEIQSNASHIDALERENWNYTWRYYYARQAGQYSAEVTPGLLAQFLDFHVGHWGSAYVGIHPYLDDLIDKITDDLENGRMGILSIKEGGKGHAVVPWRVVRGGSLDRTYIYIYDPNHEKASIDHSTNYSDFELYPYIECNIRGRFGDGWWIYQWNSTSVWDEEIYYTSYSDAIGDEGQLNYIDSVDITDHDIPAGISYLVAIGSGGSTYYAEDSSGRRTGIVDGSLLTEIPDSFPMVDLAGPDSMENIMLYLPENVNLTFNFETSEENGEFSFSFNNKNTTYSIVNKSISKGIDEKISISPRQSTDDHEITISGNSDSDYSVKITKEYENGNGKKVAREYTANKNSTSNKEEVKISISEDLNSLKIQNNGDSEISYNIDFRSTESLDNMDFIPYSIGSVTVTKDHESTATPIDWSATEMQAAISETTEKVQVQTDENETTPGFEILVMIFALFFIIIYKKKK